MSQQQDDEFRASVAYQIEENWERIGCEAVKGAARQIRWYRRIKFATHCTILATIVLLIQTVYNFMLISGLERAVASLHVLLEHTMC